MSQKRVISQSAAPIITQPYKEKNDRTSFPPDSRLRLRIPIQALCLPRNTTPAQLPPRRQQAGQATQGKCHSCEPKERRRRLRFPTRLLRVHCPARNDIAPRIPLVQAGVGAAQGDGQGHAGDEPEDGVAGVEEEGNGGPDGEAGGADEEEGEEGEPGEDVGEEGKVDGVRRTAGHAVVEDVAHEGSGEESEEELDALKSQVDVRWKHDDGWMCDDFHDEEMVYVGEGLRVYNLRWKGFWIRCPNAQGVWKCEDIGKKKEGGWYLRKCKLLTVSHGPWWYGKKAQGNQHGSRTRSRYNQTQALTYS